MGPGLASAHAPQPWPARLRSDTYLPRDQVLELLDLLVGLRVLLQVALCEEGLGETESRSVHLLTQLAFLHTHRALGPWHCPRQALLSVPPAWPWPSAAEVA